jgi:hypothetical protein
VDTIIAGRSSGIPDTMHTKSLFQEHLLPVKTKKPQPHNTHFDFTVTGILFLSFILFVWLYAFNRKRLNQIVKGFYIHRFANQLAREEVAFGNRVSLFLSTLFILTATLFTTKMLGHYRLFETQSEYILFLQIAAVLLGIYALKIISVKLVGFIAQMQKPAADYTMTVFLFCNTLGLVMLPLVIGMVFIRQIQPIVFIYTGIFIFITFSVIRLIRGIVIGLNYPRISKFYLFLYICALELVPFIIMAKLFLLRIG